MGADGWRYTARPEWSSDGESIWMRLAKFSWCNRLSVTALATLFAIDSDGTAALDLRHAQRWNTQALATMLEISADEVHAGFCAGPASNSILEQFKYCPSCLELGFHAAWFQSLHIERCPLHRRQMQTGCVRCRAPVPYSLGQALASQPLCCTGCGCAWVPSLSRPAGRCRPLDRRSTRLLGRWAAYVRHLTAHECPSPRQRQEGQFVATAALPFVERSHPLTLVNRWFDAPPPLTAQLLARRPPRHGKLPCLSVTERPVAGYDRAQWPHFGRRFAQCEQVLAEARMRLFGGVHHECMTGCWRYLLNIGLAVPCALMDGATAAALGWSMAWTSPVQTVAPSPESSMPALGLATWLACLPLRPPQTPRHQWHLQVLQWLAEDLELSAWAWSRIAAFMQAKGHYVLHGAIGHPKDLAQRHHVEIDDSGRFTSKVE